MFHLQQNTRSYWQEIEPPVTLPLSADRHTDVCVVGGGIAGSLSAYILLKHGHQVVMIDKEPFGENETAHTSAHLSNVLDEGIDELIKLFGVEGAKKAVQSHADAISLIEKIIEEEGIDCDFRRIKGYLFEKQESQKTLNKEWAASQKIGFEGIRFLHRNPLFSDLGPAIEYPNQARIHALKFLRGLWTAIERMGGEIYTLTKAVGIGGGDKPFIKTAQGFFVYAKNIIVATHIPIHDRFVFPTKDAAYRSYVIGFEVQAGSFPDYLMWDTQDPYHYVRLIPGTSEDKDTVLVGGQDRRVGQDNNPEQRFSDLEIWARHALDMTVPVSMKWSGQIIEPVDGLAYIGRSPGQEHIYMCTGDSGHGLTHAAIAAMIFRDLIDGAPNEWEELYSPVRLKARGARDLISETANTFVQYLDWFYLEDEIAKDSLLPGEGTLTRHKGSPVALYCDQNNKIHAMSAVCPHLGGVVHWNQAEKTWDCPCHGSRFAATGEVLNGPAIEDLRPTEVTSSDEIQALNDSEKPKEVL
ncbi:oxidoreductase [Bdellovibrio bacteriovorus]|uniref:Oxidoreductase n=1 Tax=Bdellovibrio bacteriovorus TaxID=959 RepID=A0A150WJ31_BDEBC|nr:FAD-dependent oxidoreductase [Bdellovibrio bacteriovorus]KYG63633.1 oxidoreductase [Bdellovibrio bacteriovorus]